MAHAWSAKSSAGWLMLERNGLKHLNHSQSSNARSEISFGTNNPASAIAWSAPVVIFCVTAKIADGLRSLVKSGPSAGLT